uniref:Rx N-terminal domain-containing protein n=1 Tax=Setaria italica TaxID=4555 RepID=K3Y1D8_SETIT
MVGVGEFLASAALKQVGGMLGSAIWEAIASQLKLGDELKGLKDTVDAIQNSMVRVEKRLMKDGDVCVWMRELKAAAYDMEDIIMEFEGAILSNKDDSQNNKSTTEISIPLKLRLSMPSKLKAMKQRLDNIEKLRRFDLMVDTSSDDQDVIQTRATGPCLVEGILGRDKDKLGALPYDDCWKLFKAKAFPNGIKESEMAKVHMGEKIVKKCDGVPLAVKSLGDRLLDMPMHKWEETLKSDLWEHERDPTTGTTSTAILPSLKISYYHMPYYLRPCFVYFSAFPKGFVIEKRELIHKWIALRFVLTTHRAEEYLHELCQMSFLEATSDSISNMAFIYY